MKSTLIELADGVFVGPDLEDHDDGDWPSEIIWKRAPDETWRCEFVTMSVEATSHSAAEGSLVYRAIEQLP